jgi:hypothetical protein
MDVQMALPADVQQVGGFVLSALRAEPDVMHVPAVALAEWMVDLAPSPRPRGHLVTHRLRDDTLG